MVGLLGLLPLAIVGLLGACGSDSANVGPGGTCFAASDCQPGLVCIPPKNGNGNSVCSSDLSSVEGKPPPEAGPAEAGEAGDATVTDAPVEDTAAPDTGVDAGVKDAGDAG